MSKQAPRNENNTPKPSKALSSEELITQAYAAIKGPSAHGAAAPPSGKPVDIAAPSKTASTKSNNTKIPSPSKGSNKPAPKKTAPATQKTVPSVKKTQSPSQQRRTTSTQTFAPPPQTTTPRYTSTTPGQAASKPKQTAQRPQGAPRNAAPSKPQQTPKKKTSSSATFWIVCSLFIIFGLPWLSDVLEGGSCSSSSTSSYTPSSSSSSSSNSSQSYTDSSGDSAIETELVRVGNETVGYVDIPSQFVLEPNEDGSTNQLRYVDAERGNVIVLTAYLPEDGLSQLERAEQASNEISNMTNGSAYLYENEFSLDTIVGPVNQLYGFATDGDASEIIDISQYFFTTTDGITRSFLFENTDAMSMSYRYDDGEFTSYFDIVRMLHSFDASS